MDEPFNPGNHTPIQIVAAFNRGALARPVRDNFYEHNLWRGAQALIRHRYGDDARYYTQYGSGETEWYTADERINTQGAGISTWPTVHTQACDHCGCKIHQATPFPEGPFHQRLFVANWRGTDVISKYMECYPCFKMTDAEIRTVRQGRSLAPHMPMELMQDPR